jgi:tyrosinase
MLHHCNVDRLWAYWQALNPNETVFTGTYAGKPRYSTPDRTTISPKSPLNPFYRTKEAFHTTESVTSIKGFGYSYQGLENSKWSSNQVKTNVKKIINDLYRYDDNDDSSSRLVRRDEEKTRYFVTVQLDVTQVERPCSVDVYLDGEHAGSLVVMAQPPYGTIHGSFAIDKVVEKKGMHYLATDEAVDKIESALDVKIVKVGYLRHSPMSMNTN